MPSWLGAASPRFHLGLRGCNETSSNGYLGWVHGQVWLCCWWGVPSRPRPHHPATTLSLVIIVPSAWHQGGPTLRNTPPLDICVASRRNRRHSGSSVGRVARGARRDGETADGNPLLGIKYIDANFSGRTLTLYGTTGNGCTTDGPYDNLHLAGIGWGDTISSARAYSGCTAVYWENGGLTGAQYLCGCSSLGVMNDETSSIRFR